MSNEFLNGYLIGDNLRKSNDLARQSGEIDSLKEQLRHSKQSQAPIPQHVLPASEIKAMQDKIAFYETTLALERQKFAKQQETIANWMLSQKAFRETTLKLGKELGKNKEQLDKEIKESEQKVINNTTEFGNNSKDSPFLSDYLEKKSTLK